MAKTLDDTPLVLGVLDQSPIPDGSTGGQALRNTLDLARLADSLGYSRYWVAEHHGTPGLALAAPEVMIGLLAAETQHMRIGSGGIMLPHYSPLKVAETFSMLSALYPDRIDLGIGRAAGTDGSTTLALQRDRRQRSPDDFHDQLLELLEDFQYRETTTPRQFRKAVLPGGSARPVVSLLGSSPQSAVWAAELGLPYTFADFINPFGADAAHHYRSKFQPSAVSQKPHVTVAAWAICADTEAEAKHLAQSFYMMMVMLHAGRLIAVPTPDEAKQFLDQNPDLLAGLLYRRRVLLGTPEQVELGIRKVAEEYAADEVLLVNILHSHEARRRSYELIADVFGLQAKAEKQLVSA
jgi:luciferase family oxidoreductase group 1